MVWFYTEFGKAWRRGTFLERGRAVEGRVDGPRNGLACTRRANVNWAACERLERDRETGNGKAGMANYSRMRRGWVFFSSFLRFVATFLQQRSVEGRVPV